MWRLFCTSVPPLRHIAAIDCPPSDDPFQLIWPGYHYQSQDRVKSQLVLRDASVKVSYIPCNSSFIEMKELKAVVRLFKLKLSTDILKVRTRYRDSRDFIIYLLQTHCTASEPPSPLLPVECQLTFTFLSAAAYCCRAASSKILHFTRHQNAPRRHRRV